MTDARRYVWWHVSATLFFSATTHYFFKKYCVVRHVRNYTISFLEKIMCCGKFVTTRYFFKKYCVVRHVRNTIFFEKNNVLWQTCHNRIFFEKYCVVASLSQHITFESQHSLTMPLIRLSTGGMNHTCLYCPAAERHRTLAGTHFPTLWG